MNNLTKNAEKHNSQKSQIRIEDKEVNLRNSKGYSNNNLVNLSTNNTNNTNTVSSNNIFSKEKDNDNQNIIKTKPSEKSNAVKQSYSKFNANSYSNSNNDLKEELLLALVKNNLTHKYNSNNYIRSKEKDKEMISNNYTDTNTNNNTYASTNNTNLNFKKQLLKKKSVKHVKNISNLSNNAHANNSSLNNKESYLNINANLINNQNNSNSNVFSINTNNSNSINNSGNKNSNQSNEFLKFLSTKVVNQNKSNALINNVNNGNNNNTNNENTKNDQIIIKNSNKYLSYHQKQGSVVSIVTPKTPKTPKLNFETKTSSKNKNSSNQQTEKSNPKEKDHKSKEKETYYNNDINNNLINNNNNERFVEFASVHTINTKANTYYTTKQIQYSKYYEKKFNKILNDLDQNKNKLDNDLLVKGDINRIHNNNEYLYYFSLSIKELVKLNEEKERNEIKYKIKISKINKKLKISKEINCYYPALFQRPTYYKQNYNNNLNVNNSNNLNSHRKFNSNIKGALKKGLLTKTNSNTNYSNNNNNNNNSNNNTSHNTTLSIYKKGHKNSYQMMDNSYNHLTKKENLGMKNNCHTDRNSTFIDRKEFTFLNRNKHIRKSKTDISTETSNNTNNIKSTFGVSSSNHELISMDKKPPANSVFKGYLNLESKRILNKYQNPNSNYPNYNTTNNNAKNYNNYTSNTNNTQNRKDNSSENNKSWSINKLDDDNIIYESNTLNEEYDTERHKTNKQSSRINLPTQVKPLDFSTINSQMQQENQITSGNKNTNTKSKRNAGKSGKIKKSSRRDLPKTNKVSSKQELYQIQISTCDNEVSNANNNSQSINSYINNKPSPRSSCRNTNNTYAQMYMVSERKKTDSNNGQLDFVNTKSSKRVSNKNKEKNKDKNINIKHEKSKLLNVSISLESFNRKISDSNSQTATSNFYSKQKKQTNSMKSNHKSKDREREREYDVDTNLCDPFSLREFKYSKEESFSMRNLLATNSNTNSNNLELYRENTNTNNSKVIIVNSKSSYAETAKQDSDSKSGIFPEINTTESLYCNTTEENSKKNDNKESNIKNTNTKGKAQFNINNKIYDVELMKKNFQKKQVNLNRINELSRRQYGGELGLKKKV